jgi:hypothetical protein
MMNKEAFGTFASIAYSAIQLQLNHVNSEAAKGCDVVHANETLFLAQNITDTVLNYSLDCVDMTGFTENDIVRLCDWLTKNLKFTTDPLGIINGFRDFNKYDFNKKDFA